VTTRIIIIIINLKTNRLVIKLVACALCATLQQALIWKTVIHNPSI
jgi:hypothetical protein